MKDIFDDFNFECVYEPEVSQQAKEISPFENELIKQHEDELEKLRHKYKMKDKRFFYWFARFAMILIVVFLIILFFVIKPVSQMDFSRTMFEGYVGSRRLWSWVSKWSRAFLTTMSSFGMTLAAFILSEILKKAFAFIKDYEKNLG